MPENDIRTINEDFFVGNEEFLSSHSSDSGNYSPKSSSSDVKNFFKLESLYEF